MRGLTKFCEGLFKDDGFILVDANKKEYVIGKRIKNPPIKLKLLNKSQKDHLKVKWGLVLL